MGKIYFASDFHLGVPSLDESKERERRIIRWMNSIKHDCDELYLVGDIFDFWFEYKTVVPKGFVRLLGKLAEWRDEGIPIYFFTGNHDIWMFSYFEDELDIPIYREPIERTFKGKKFFIGHGDGLGPGDYKYKQLKKVFTNPVCQWLFARLHPNFGISLALFWSKVSRKANKGEGRFLGEEREWLVQYSKKKNIERPDIDYFVFGHRHLPISFRLNDTESRYINLGEWRIFSSYGVFDGERMEVRFFENETGSVYTNDAKETVKIQKSTFK